MHCTQIVGGRIVGNVTSVVTVFSLGCRNMIRDGCTFTRRYIFRESGQIMVRVDS